MEFVGSAIVGIVAVQLFVLLLGQIQQVQQSRRQRRLSVDLLQQRIGAANALREQREQTRLFWNGYRKFVVKHKSEEAHDVVSFYLAPHDGKDLPQFKPGQYLTFQLNIPGQKRPVVRCYSLSDRPNAGYYRVSIKRVQPPRDAPDAPPGLVSNYFIDHVSTGDILDVQAPRGHFTFDPAHSRPSVFIGGGVGITPLISMLASVEDYEVEREIHLFYGIRNRSEHAFQGFLDDFNQRHDKIHIYSCYSKPLPDDVEGKDYHFAERVSVDLLKRVLGSNNYDFYICGPPAMMSSVIGDLKNWGVPQAQIFAESFGPASGKSLAATKPQPAPAAGASPTKITFQRSGKTLSWNGGYGNILDFALGNDVTIDSGCRAGSCGSCLVAIKSGRVNCMNEANAQPEEGTCLTCISVPQPGKELVLDV